MTTLRHLLRIYPNPLALSKFGLDLQIAFHQQLFLSQFTAYPFVLVTHAFRILWLRRAQRQGVVSLHPIQSCSSYICVRFQIWMIQGGTG